MSGVSEWSQGSSLLWQQDPSTKLYVVETCDAKTPHMPQAKEVSSKQVETTTITVLVNERTYGRTHEVSAIVICLPITLRRDVRLVLSDQRGGN